MAARDYPPDPGDAQSAPREPRPREYGGSPTEGGPLQKAVAWARWLLTALTVVYCVSYLVILYALEFHAENYQLLSTLMYAPPWAWLLPIIPLGGVAIFLYARLLIPLGVCIPIMIFVYMDLRWHNWGTPLNPTFKVVTNNIGQDHKKSFKPFADLQRADIIALQDANAAIRGPEFAKDYPDRYVAGKDQFILISKFPIRAADALPMVDPSDSHEVKQRVAAWFEVDVNGKTILVFVLHMPTPRDQIEAMKSPSALAAGLGKSTGNSGKIREQNQDFFKTQQELARQMIQVTRQAKVPFIVCGDFNVPTHGIIYRS
jgi:endonuclease/exonuclease/phosphatase (EEP) superfamily protein YafD